MAQRFTLDRSSFEQFLAAASLLQQFQKQASRKEADVQPFWVLIDLQRGVQSGSLGPDVVIQQVPELACLMVGGSGAGVWLFSNNDDAFTWRAGTVRYAEDERLRLEVLSRLAAMDDEPSDWRSASRNWDAGYYPGCVKSLLVEPIYQGRNIAGAIAAFATDFDAFTERDASKIRLLAGVLGQALDSASKAGLQQAVALERYALRELIERLIPRLQSLADTQAHERHRSNRIQRLYPQPTGQELFTPAEPPSPGWDDLGEQQALSSSPEFESTDEEQDEVSAPVADVYIPGIGVRAALGYDDEKEPSQLWAHLRGALTRVIAGAFGAAATCFRFAAQGGKRAGTSCRVLLASTGEHFRHAVEHRPKLPSIPLDGIRARIEKTGSTCRDVGRRAASRVRAARQVSLPALPKESIEQGLSSAETWMENSLRAVGRALRGASKVVPDLPTLPVGRVRQGLNQAARSVGNAVGQGATGMAGRIARKLPAAPTDVRLDWPAFRRALPALAVLIVMAAFVFSEPGVHKTLEVASASTKASASPAAILPPAAASHVLVKAVGTPDLMSSPTHRKITDAETDSDLHNMTRYEIATVRRSAEYGDDVAAFQLGMAYEIGYDVPQNCAKAADWVRRAAEAGNAAAQYNLGLRYRDGDGVTANREQAESWLRKSADRKNADARSALASMASASSQ